MRLTRDNKAILPKNIWPDSTRYSNYIEFSGNKSAIFVIAYTIYHYKIVLDNEAKACCNFAEASPEITLFL